MAVRITIIGGGPGGYTAAIRAAQTGCEVTLIEEDRVGGTCLNRGCIPSKIMKRAAEMIEDIKRAREFGLTLDGKVTQDISSLMERKHRIIQNQIKWILGLLEKHGVRYLQGHGFIKGHKLAAVIQEDGKEIEVPFDSLILALGSEASGIQELPFDGRRIISSTEALNIQEIPESILIVGAGAIGCEFAFIFSSFGSKVTLIEAMPRILPLPSVDEEISRVLQREMKKRRIDFMPNNVVKKAENINGSLNVTLMPFPFKEEKMDEDISNIQIKVDCVLVCIGRKPGSSGVGLENAGVGTDEKGWIIADDHMRTSVPDVYAIGDILGPSKFMFAHVASKEGLVAAENAAGNSRSMNYSAVPGAIYTMPEVACVGLTGVQATQMGYDIRSDSVLFRTLGKSQVIGEIAGEMKLVSEVGSGRILGVHIVGPHATELIAEGVLAVNTGCTVNDLAETIHAHPTLSEIFLEVSLKALDRPLQ
ncbi:MAG: dihydrolipoyl dehydrogenase [Deltaproteobacteria bacterium]|nr:dihydrolipoyl dehydrogenase [Deltaproteobacteria bacterium]